MSRIELEPVRVLREAVAPHDAVLTGDYAQSQGASLSTGTSSLTRTQACLIVVTVAGVSFLNTLGSGLLTVSLPRIATDLGLAPNLLLWPASVYALTMGCSLLLVGTVADVVGNRPIFLTGCALLSAFTLGCSLARTGIELIAFRALQGIAMAFCMPTAVGLITSNFPAGRGRNIAFACLGGGSPVGFALGLVLGGLFVDSIGWRYGYYLSCGVNGMIFLAAFFTTPASATGGDRMRRLQKDIDWIGVTISSACMAMLSYVFAMITSSTSTIRHPPNVALLSISVALIPAFIFWVGRQERLGKPAIIPNSIWRNPEFTSVCITVFLTWAMFNAFGYFTTLLFQDVQHISATQTSLRFLPMVVMGFVTNILTGFLVDKLPASILVLVASLLSAVSPAVYATLSPKSSYWVAAFPAMCLSPVSSDLLFTVSNLVITANFRPNEQALAGGVFNTISQLGNSIGLAVTAMIASSVTMGAKNGNAANSQTALDGYRAAFWMCFAAALVSSLVSSIGLRKSGKVGLKRE
jgi:MFS family permease